MIEKLFVYGTLGPSRPNEHILSNIGGDWEDASIKGLLINEGWGSEMGYPALKLDKQGKKIDAFLFTSQNLINHWHELDKFEGDAYLRVLTQVTLADGSTVQANVYTLNKE